MSWFDAARARARLLPARRAIGGVDRRTESLRHARGLAWLGGLSLDLRLGLRMLARYPGLTVVGVVGIAVAVAISATAFRILGTVVDPSLPLDEGDRLVAIANVDVQGGDASRTHLHDLADWRASLTAVSELGAYRTVDRNLITAGGRPEPVRIAEMSASGFRIARVAPALGRYLLEADEREGAPAVVVIGHSLWQSRFGGDSGVVGRTVQLGVTPHTVVGVMPEGYAFPVNNRVWTALRLDPADFARGQAPVVNVFGRLAPGATLEQANVQATTIADRLALEHPAIYELVQPRVMKYAHSFIEVESSVAYRLTLVLVNILLVIIGTNVAILVFARTASRTAEIAVRSALGASRSRIVVQFFAEAFVLAAVAAIAGLLFAREILKNVDVFAASAGAEQLPFWFRFDLSAGMVVYAFLLAVFGAAIVGIVPALKATGRSVSAGFQQLGTHGASLRLGRGWTAMIVSQVALAVAVLPVGLFGTTLYARYAMVDPNPALREYLTAGLHLDREGFGADDPQASDEAFRHRHALLQGELIDRLEAEPAVTNVVVMTGEETMSIEVDAPAPRPGTDTAAREGVALDQANWRRVEPDYFEAFDVAILAGRGFTSGDAIGSASPAIVNRAFVQKVLGGGDPIGRRVRRRLADDGHASAMRVGPWIEIVGVASDFPRAADPVVIAPRLYQPMRVGEAYPTTMAIRVRGQSPESFAGRLREMTVALDPMLRLRDVLSLEESTRRSFAPFRIMFIAVAALALSVILLSAAGIYALMSFTVTKRRREIGIRTALGAGPRRVLGAILSRAFAQIALGIAIGIVLAAIMNRVTGGDMFAGREAVVLPAVAGLMAVVGLLATLGPARRGLSIQPTEALRPD